MFGYMRETGHAVRFDRSTVEGRLAEMAYLDGLTDEEVAEHDPGHRYVTRNPAETPEQRAVLLRRLTEAEKRLEEFKAQQS